MATKRDAAQETVDLLRQLAEEPDRVEVFGTAKYSLMGSDLTKEDVCDAICKWIDMGKPVKETTIHTIPELIDEAAYEMKPKLNKQRYYLKVYIEKVEDSDELMLILSAHPDY